MLTLNTKIEHLPGVGPSLKRTLNNLGLFYIEDLLYHLPFRYIDFSQKIPIGQAEVGQMVTLQGVVLEISARRSFRSRLQFAECTLEDNTGTIKLVWFNQPYIAKQIKVGDQIVVAGKIEWYKQKQITNPFFEQSVEDSGQGKILPVYHLTKGITNLRLAKMVKTAWEACHEEVIDELPQQISAKFSLQNIEQALNNLHFPLDQTSLKASQFRVALEDTLPQQIASAIKRKELETSNAPKINIDVEYIKSVLAELPFQLTNSQKRAVWDILQDLDSGKPMNRLLEGDVGSGKTMVAILASLMAGKSGFQTVIVAPTEILAKQHFETFLRFAKEFNSATGLLTSKFSISGDGELNKKDLLEQVEQGSLKILIGTHAVFSEKIKFSKLGLIIIDEQHRFGVGQRAYLTKKHASDLIPHFLSMSATPIPRTLALSLFGNLAISQLTQVPKNRLPIKTKLFTEAERKNAYDLIRKEISMGRQIFIIAPKVEESESEVKSVKTEFERLQKIFPKNKLGLVYGGLKAEEKDNVMKDFSNGELDILVATTVIEIGIDIPNATVMLIEGAENFGLAQLHQLRGRVGRGEYQSYCLLFTTQDNQLETERLKVFEKSLDGFKLAEYDLEQRGFGDLFGMNQSGFNFKYPQFLTMKALQTSREVAEELLKNDEKLTKLPNLKKKSSKYLEQIHSE